ncbi:MAG: hypothetical protein V1834_03165 [Candidatus Micrarchaeota archaeon]
MQHKTFLLISLCFLIGVALAQSEVGASLTINEEAIVVATGLSVVPAQIIQGASADLSLTLENKGNLQTSVQGNITIVNSTSDQVGLVEFNSTVLSPGDEVVLSSSWSTAGFPAGTYAARGQGIYGGVYTNLLEESFTIYVASPDVGGGGVGGTPSDKEKEKVPIELPKKIEPEIGEIKLTKKIVLREIMTGEGGIGTIEIRNTAGSTQKIKIAITGAPEGFVSSQQNELVLPAKQSALLGLGFNIPADAKQGDYLVSLSIAGEGTVTKEFMILRVKGYPPDYPAPRILRTVELDEKERSTLVTLVVKNPGLKKVAKLEIFEEIPARLNIDANKITFIDNTAAILSQNPLIMGWKLSELEPGESRTISYKLGSLAHDYSAYAYWQLKSAAYNTDDATGLLKIQELSVPVMRIGETATATAKLFYGGLNSLDASIYLQVPAGEFSIEPEMRQAYLAPRSLTPFSFDITPKTGATPGTHMAELVIASGEVTLSQTIVFIVEEPRQSFISGLDKTLIYGLIAFILLLMAATWLYPKAKRKIKDRKFPSELSEDRSEYLHQVKEGVLEKDVE